MKINKPCALCGKPSTDKHHLLSNTKQYRKMYGALLDESFNLVYLCNGCHLTKTIPKYTEFEFRAEAKKLGYNLPPMSKSSQFLKLRGEET